MASNIHEEGSGTASPKAPSALNSEMPPGALSRTKNPLEVGKASPKLPSAVPSIVPTFFFKS